MDWTRGALQAFGLHPTDHGDLEASTVRFADGRPFHIEIPSVEGPVAFQAVLDAAKLHGVQVDRISQGSGVMLQTDDEIREMVALGAQNDIEVCLFVGPRASWDIGAQAFTRSGAVGQAALRGADQLVYAVEDVRHACELGLRGFLVADVGLLWVLGEMRNAGDLPEDLILKVSISLPAGNPATARLLTDLGADTINLPVDLTLGQISAIRRSTDVPLDIYVEGADDFGSPVRYYEIPQLVEVASPVHLKFTVRNAPGIYPSGGHLENTVVSTAKERVRRAAIGMGILHRYNGGE